MKKVVINFFTPLREVAGENKTEVEGDNLPEIIEKLIIKYGNKFRDVLLEKENGNVKPTFFININGMGINPSEISNVKIKDGDTISIFPIIYGA